MIKEKSNVAGCDFQQRESAYVAQDTTGETLGDDKEPASGMKRQQPFQAAFKSMSRGVHVAGTLQFVSPDAGFLFQHMHLSKVLIKSNIRQKM